MCEGERVCVWVGIKLNRGKLEIEKRWNTPEGKTEREKIVLKNVKRLSIWYKENGASRFICGFYKGEIATIVTAFKLEFAGRYMGGVCLSLTLYP